MKNPTSNGNDLYQVANDYPQAPISAYFVASSYKDGIYTELSDTAKEYTTVSSVDGFDNSFFNLKTPSGLNKRVLTVLPQSGWDVVTSAGVAGEVSAVSGEKYFSDDYATAELEAFPE
jgi:hypothetical protein